MKVHLKTVWLSDIHLGSKDCKADYLLDFLASHQIDTLYLVGDIIDLWAMQKNFRWPEAHNQVLHKLYQLSFENTRVVYLPGNHDAPLQQYSGMALGNVEIHRQCIHQCHDGKRLLVLHGDQFDQDVCFGAVHAWIGDKGYDLLLWVNRTYNRIRHWQGKPYWSLAGHIKKHIHGAHKAIERYKQACCRRAKHLGLDGVVCGHIHHPQIGEFDGITYMNDGDWIENCSALTEDHSGHIALVHWTKRRHQPLVSIERSPKNNSRADSKAA